MKIGILGIQGAYDAHSVILKKLGAEVHIVKYSRDLNDIDGLIIPGGESTVFTKIFGFRIHNEDIIHFASKKSVFGTCAGLILMGRNLDDYKVRQLGLMDAVVTRNSYGRQTESFESDVIGCLTPPFHAVFIRAPRIESTGDTVKVCASLNGEAVWIENERHYACSFHPELTEDTRIHAAFLEKIRKQNEL